MKGIVVFVVVVVAAVLAVFVLGAVGPFVAVAGVLLALLVVVNPGGAGTRLRESMAWWSIPGLRRASTAALPFAAMLLLYTVPVPMAAFALTHAGGQSSSAPATATVAGNGVGGGSSSATEPASATLAPPLDSVTSPTVAASAVPTDTPTAAPTAVPTAVPTAAPTAAPATARPTAAPPPPARNLCGAPANPYGYNFCGGGVIPSPPADFCTYFSCIASFWDHTNGYVEECADGMYSHSGGVRGSCSSHGGNQRPLNP